MSKKRIRAKDTPLSHSSTAGSDQSWSIEVLHAQRTPESAIVPVVRLRAQRNDRLMIVSCTCARFAEAGTCVDIWAASLIMSSFPQGSVAPENGLTIRIDGRDRNKTSQLKNTEPPKRPSDKTSLFDQFKSRPTVAEVWPSIKGPKNGDRPNVLLVPSQSSSAHFAVNLLTKTCSCSSWRRRKIWCKHLEAARLWMARK